MAKAITGAAIIAAGALIVATGGIGFAGVFMVGTLGGWSLVAMGAGMELSALGNALQGQKAIATTVRQPAAPRRVIYGTQRVGSVEAFESTTGSEKDQYNMVLLFACHEITNFLTIYLDGRQVFWHGAGTGWSVRNGIGFGGGADGLLHTGPDGSQYLFNNATTGHSGVYCEARFGDQAAGDYMSSLTANDGRWGPDGSGNVPTGQGHAYLYLKVEYDTGNFPNKPDCRALMMGKPIYDPRTSTTAYSENWALVVADILSNTDYGLGMPVNAAQLIAAANICDETVAFAGAGGGNENRYTAHYTWTLDRDIGTVLNDLMNGAGGRISWIEGEWYIFPATYVASSATFTSAQLIDRPKWSSQRKYREKFNLVQGTYIAPSWPYSVAGNYYGFGATNGDGTTAVQNNFDYGYQPTSYPTFCLDTAHGYSSNQYLLEDGGVELPLSLDFASVLSVTQAQRLAKIALLRNRQQGSGTLVFGPEALILQPNDTFLYSDPKRGWVDKILEVVETNIEFVRGSDGAIEIRVTLQVQETDPSVYEWVPTDELTYSYQPAVLDTGRFTIAPPTSLVLTSSAATALVQPDGSVQPRIQVAWNTPADIRVSAIDVQYQLTTATAWTDAGQTSVASNLAFISATAGKEYNVRIRSVTASGAVSVWVEVDGLTAGLVLAVQTQDGVGIGSLVGEAYSGGTAAIDCQPFTAQVGTLQLPIFPGGTVQITTDGTIGGSGGALQQKTLYYVYYQDPTYVGGNVTPIATTNRNDFVGKLCYFLIDSIVTPYNGTGSSPIYRPNNSSDSGSRTTTNPQFAYDGNSATAAVVSGSATATWNGVHTTGRLAYGTCTWLFPAITTTADATLTVSAAAVCSFSSTDATAGTLTITVNIGSASTELVSLNGTTALTGYTIDIPSGTDLSTVTVQVAALPGDATSDATTTSSSSTMSGSIYEIGIQ